MHHIFHTEAIVLGSYEKAESDSLTALYTKEFGLVFANARGARNLRSKLRYALQPYSIVQLDLISIKGGFRVGSVRSIVVPSALSLKTYSTLYKLSKLVRRLCAGEEKNIPLFQSLTETMSMLLSGTITDERIPSIELIAVLRTLFHLGYITDDFASPFTEGELTPALIENAAVARRTLVSTINQSLKETML